MTSRTEKGSEMSEIEGTREKTFVPPSSDTPSLGLEESKDGLENGRKTEKDLRQQDPAKETVSSVKPSQNQSKDMTDTAYQHLSRDFKRLERENNDLRQDIRLLDRENREQSLDLRDLKKQIALLQDVKRQNAQLQDAYRVRGEMTENQKEQIRKEMEKLVEQLHQKDDLNLHLRQELQKRKNHMDSLTIQTREANEEKANLEFANQKLARQNRLLSENLTECKDDLLRLQPPSQISDSEVSEQYLNLHQQISRWVDDETEDSQLLEQRFESLSMNNKDFPESLRKYLESDHLRIAKKYPNAQLYVLRRIIQRYLDDCILSDEIHLFGLDPNMIGLLKGMEQGMRRLEPRRDAVTIRHWRSETLKSICQMNEFCDEQQKQAIVIAKSLQTLLSFLLPAIDRKKDGWKELYDHIVCPAIQVSSSMQLSSANYWITSRMPKPPDQSTAVFVNEIQKCEMVDITSHKIIRPDSVLKIAEDGRIGEQMLVVQPALLRGQKDSGSSIILCKPTVLVRLDEPMGRKNRGIKALTSWLAGDVGE